MEQWMHHSALVHWCTYFQSDQRWRFHCHSILLHLSWVASCFVFMQKEFLIISRCSKLSACHSQGVTVAALFPIAFCFNDISIDLLYSFYPLWRGNTAFAQGQMSKGKVNIAPYQILQTQYLEKVLLHPCLKDKSVPQGERSRFPTPPWSILYREHMTLISSSAPIFSWIGEWSHSIFAS